MTEVKSSIANVSPENKLAVVHPSETIGWPPQQEFFASRDLYINRLMPETVGFLKRDENFKYKDNPEICNDAAKIFARTLFVEALMQPLYPDKSIPIKPLGTPLDRRPDTCAQTVDIYTLDDREILNINTVVPEDVEKLRLKEFYISMNMNYYGDKLMERNKHAQKLLDRGEPQKDVEEWKKYRANRIGIAAETIMVEEVAHVIYIMNAAQDPQSLRRYAQDIKRDTSYFPKDPDAPLTDEQRELIYISDFEVDGDKWRKSYFRHFYPVEYAETYPQKSS